MMKQLNIESSKASHQLFQAPKLLTYGQVLY